jgi:hypothetical protein
MVPKNRPIIWIDRELMSRRRVAQRAGGGLDAIGIQSNDFYASFELNATFRCAFLISLFFSSFSIVAFHRLLSVKVGLRQAQASLLQSSRSFDINKLM